MDREVPMIDNLPHRVRIRIALQRPNRPRLLSRIMPRIRRSRRIPQPHRRIDSRIRDRPRPAAIPDHLEPLVPLRRQLDDKLRLRPDDTLDLAMRRQIRQQPRLP